jgi:hypothetical protein
MAHQTLHLSAYPCEKCGSPVVAGSLWDQKGQITEVGAVCLHCGNRQAKVPKDGGVIQFDAKDWG